MIFGLLSSTQGQQFDPSVFFLLALCSTHHLRQCDTPYDHVQNKIFFHPLVTPGAPKSLPWGMTKVSEQKSCSICFIPFICELNEMKLYEDILAWLDRGKCGLENGV